jgi:hypothetical protein
VWNIDILPNYGSLIKRRNGMDYLLETIDMSSDMYCGGQDITAHNDPADQYYIQVYYSDGINSYTETTDLFSVSTQYIPQVSK